MGTMLAAHHGQNCGMDFIDLPRGDARWMAALPVLRELRSELTEESLNAILAEGEPQGLRFSAVIDVQASGDEACLGVAGWRIVANTSTGRKLYIDDLVTAAGARSRGVGRRMLQELIARARDAGCSALELDSGVQRFDAHRFYLRERMSISAHHFSLRL